MVQAVIGALAEDCSAAMSLVATALSVEPFAAVVPARAALARVALAAVALAAAALAAVVLARVVLARVARARAALLAIVPAREAWLWERCCLRQTE